MNRYQFERVPKYLEQTYGKIRHGDEGGYELFLMTLESNIYYTFVNTPGAHEVDIGNGLLLAMHVLNDRDRGVDSEAESFATEHGKDFRDAILFAFDPHYNDELKTRLEDVLADWETSRDYKSTIKLGAMCMIRIYESYQFWRQNGSYFRFIEDFFREGKAKPEHLNFIYQVKELVDH